MEPFYRAAPPAWLASCCHRGMRSHLAHLAALATALFATPFVGGCSGSPETGGSTSQTVRGSAPTPAPSTGPSAVAATGDAGTKAPASGDVCAAEPEDDTCSTCVKQKCCAPVRTCLADAQCSALDGCMAKCFDGVQQPGAKEQQCVTACQAQYPQGRAKVDAIDACVEQSCAAQCQ